MVYAKIDFALKLILERAEKIFRCNINGNYKLLFEFGKINSLIQITVFCGDFIGINNSCLFSELKQGKSKAEALAESVSVRMGVSQNKNIILL